jgi:hypothetical protein
VRTGDGTTTVLEFVSGGAKISGTFEVTGQITALGVPVFKRLTADVTASTTTEVAISTFDFVPVSGAVYQVEMDVIAYAAATTTGVRIINTGGAGTLLMVDPGSQYLISATGGAYAPTSSPIATANYGIRLAGIFAPSSTATLSFSVYSEVAASAVTLKAGSILKITRIS